MGRRDVHLYSGAVSFASCQLEMAHGKEIDCDVYLVPWKGNDVVSAYLNALSRSG